MHFDRRTYAIRHRTKTNNHNGTKPGNPQTQGDELLAKAKANKGKLTGALIFCIVVVVAAFAWFFINQSGNKKAAELAGKADIEVNDSIAMKLYQEAAEAGHKSGNRAKLEVAIRYYNDGKYEDALKYLNDASVAAASLYARSRTTRPSTRPTRPSSTSIPATSTRRVSRLTSASTWSAPA